MGPISPSIRQVVQAQQDTTRAQIDMALVGQHLEAQRQTGDQINAMIRQLENVQKQLASGHIDVRV